MQSNTAEQPEGMTLPASILREYDIRGIVDDTITSDIAYNVGRAFGSFVKRKGGRTVCVGYDGRASSPILSAAIMDGLAACGLEVEKLGVGPTPMVYFAVKDRMTDAGLMVTGSHNPPEYNGFKMTLQSGPVYGDMIQDIGQIAASGDFENGDGTIRDIDVKDSYVERLMRDFSCGKELKVAWDNGNGAAGEILRRLTDKLPGEHILLYDEIDGTFPNHHPDPTVDKNLEDLRKAVLDNGCDLGIAFDGDADRIGAVDEKGNILRCDNLMTIYAREILQDNPGATIIGDVKCSQVMYDEIARLGGKPLMWKTGHSLIKAKMAEMKSPLAGELSGHIFFGDKWYGFDDGLYCGIRLMNEVADADGPLSSLTEDLPTLFNTPEIRFEVPEEDKFSIVDAIRDRLQNNPVDGVDVNDIDGVRVSTPQGWWLLRASNTQNALVARAESDSQAGLDALTDMIRAQLTESGINASF